MQKDIYQYHTLSNGIRIVFKRVSSAVAYSGVYINVGSRDELEHEQGMAHFIEHSIFKGTTHRRSYHILNRIDGVGGELNAFTTKEETCIYASSLVEHLGRCLELFSDVLFNSVFPESELEKEREVVVEEISSYRDMPSDLIFDEFEDQIYGAHPLAHNILGSKRNVRHFTSQQVADFFNQHYTTQKMVISVVADISFDRLLRMCERYFGSRECRESPQRRVEVPVPQPFERYISRRTHQAHLLLGCAAPSLYDDSKVAFSLINNILGGPAMNSRLNVAIRERYGFCYTIESQYVPFCDAGLFYVYAGTEPDAVERVVELIKRELAKMVSEPITMQQLRAAQRQYIGQMAITNDLGMNEMQSIGKAYLNYDHVDTIEEMSRDILSVTSQDIKEVAGRLFEEHAFSLLCYRGG
ncbi:MAG: insulinase family protein [Bacteroidales bacterium]|nr:insulinase family protein [Candidatus Colimorpha onthohippi]